eukprot:14163953-Alexandrium_andersonii.AAC.1
MLAGSAAALAAAAAAAAAAARSTSGHLVASSPSGVAAGLRAQAASFQRGVPSPGSRRSSAAPPPVASGGVGDVDPARGPSASRRRGA